MTPASKTYPASKLQHLNKDFNFMTSELSQDELPIQKEGTIFQRIETVRSPAALSQSLEAENDNGEIMGKFMSQLNNDLHLSSSATERHEIDPDQQMLYNLFFVVITLR